MTHSGISSNKLRLNRRGSQLPEMFKRGYQVNWNSEAGLVRRVIVKKVISNARFKGYVHHATRDEPKYIIKSDKTYHMAIHKGSALKRVKAQMKEKP
ncbi:MAG: DUF2945 domain-containing protein [Nitrososphaerales archaeon]